MIVQTANPSKSPVRSIYLLIIPMQNMKKKEKKSEYEYCLVCKLNHNQGQRHKYFPTHKKTLSIFLSRFETKLSDVRFFLKVPISLRPEYASRNRFWCIFCDLEVDEIDSSFACNAIRHLASADHLKNLKHFLWKYGGEMDRLDNFRILDADVAKWEKKCEKHSDASDAVSSSLGPTNDIHNQIQYGNCDNFGNNSTQYIESNLSIGVLPLQNYTNEYQVSQSPHSGPFDISNVVLSPHDTSVSLHAVSCSGPNKWSSKNLTFNKNSQPCHPNSGGACTTNAHFSSEGVHQNGRTVNAESNSGGFRFLTRISNIGSEVSGGNVHSGMLPPWLENSEASGLNAQIKSVVGSHGSSLSKFSKSKKLNPKRVGAAWAEKRKMELEMEKRGEIVESKCDENWLPNFGRVWQSGSRKESRMEFEKEKTKFLKVESPEAYVNIQPYISKRMQRDQENDGDGTNHK